MRLTTKQVALSDLTRHSFKAGLGYIEHDSTPLPLGIFPQDKCLPPNSVFDGSAHYLKPPGGGPSKVFFWAATKKVWSRSGGRRLAFTATYLSSHGWAYAGAV